MNTQLATAVNNKSVKEITLAEAKTVGYNVAPGSTSGHYAVKAASFKTINEDNRQFMLEPVAGEIGLVTEKHGSVEIQTTNGVQVFCQDEHNPFENATRKSQD